MNSPAETTPNWSRLDAFPPGSPRRAVARRTVSETRENTAPEGEGSRLPVSEQRLLLFGVG